MDNIGRAIKHAANSAGNGHILGQPKVAGQITLTLTDDGSLNCAWTCTDALAIRLLAKAIETVFAKVDQENRPQVLG